MSVSCCQGDICRYGRYVPDQWRKNRETDEFYQVGGYRCYHPNIATTTYKPSKRYGGVQMGKISPICRGMWYEERQ